MLFHRFLRSPRTCFPLRKIACARAAFARAVSALAVFALAANANAFAADAPAPAVPAAPLPAAVEAQFAIVPLPAQIASLSGTGFTLTADTEIIFDAQASGAREAAEHLAQHLRAATGFPLKTFVVASNAARPAIRFAADAALATEAHTLEITAASARLAASSPAGFLYAAQTFRQLLPNAAFGTLPTPPAATTPAAAPAAPAPVWTLPAVRIADAPRFRWRGLLLDVSRHFFTVEQVKRLLDRMAFHKLNSLQLHLTDDVAWRLEIKRYPRLTTVGATGENGNGRAPARFFTQEQMRDIVAYARSLHIRVVPEIEMPGHHDAAVRSYPELLACLTTPRRSRGMCCPGKDSTLRFLENVLDEVCEVFDSPFIHIGGDECSKGEWRKCPDCKARMSTHKLKDYNELQAWFTRHFDKYLAAKGRRLIGWDEILDGGLLGGGLTPGAAVMSWRGDAHGIAHNRGGAAAANAGHDVVYSPTDFCYFDARQFERGNDGRRYLGAYKPVTLRKIYSYDPAAGVPAGKRHHVLGLQANMWTEVCASEPDLEWKIFPRTAALAEIAWTSVPVEKRDPDAFLRRIAIHRDRLLRLGINAAPLDWVPLPKPKKAAGK
ncbi:MAG: beta-N-acetylhexosaminidase [Puniceicoccales bacterium]|jgi:hexosaminidase|nr:beta-N-acetylhexosaminidase [Puniceicoccales bacterium]